MAKNKKRDIEQEYPKKQFIEKLRRLADCIENDEKFRIQITGERITVPPHAIINIEHEIGKQTEEIEFQLKWKITK
ncbi:MAG: amphi-Trp domain-containing protein [Nitrospira sp.]|nr:amphi-Trp domain-containing protein [Nitrospira sp.]